MLTDSGGLQREAAWLGTPTLILRTTTEWPELLHPAGPSLLIGVDADRVADALATLGAVTGAAVVGAAVVGIGTPHLPLIMARPCSDQL